MINSWMSFYSLILVSEGMSNRCRLPSHGGRELKIPKDFFELERFLGTPPTPVIFFPTPKAGGTWSAVFGAEVFLLLM